MPSIYSMLPNHEDLLELEPEELAGVLLEALGESQHIMLGNIMQKHLVQEYPEQHHEEILKALMEAWNWLEREGFVALLPGPHMGSKPFFVTRRGLQVKDAIGLEVYRKGNLLPKRQLHPVIAQKVWSLFLRGDCDIAVLQAFKEVEVAVRGAGRYADTDYGLPLMRKAFHITDGNLTDLNQQKPEREAISNLFAGAIGFYKNPQSHRNVPVEAEEAVEIIIFASHLLRIVETRSQSSNST